MDTPPGSEGTLVHDLHEGPDLPDGVAAGRRAAVAARRVVAGLANTSADAATLAESAVALERLADALEPHTPTTRWDRPEHRYEAHPLIGPSNPLAPPMRVERHGQEAVGTVTFGHLYEGPKGHVHGGFVAAMFDIICISAASVAQVAGLTGTLTVRYRARTPLFREIRYEARVEEVRARTAIVSGRSYLGDTLLAEAEGIFVRIAGSP